MTKTARVQGPFYFVALKQALNTPSMGQDFASGLLRQTLCKRNRHSLRC